jgi:NADH:ubiquinone reductase (H+-translocating)
MATEKKRIIIVGGGFAGLHLAKKLNNSNYQVILVDRQNHHQFQPLFYQVATARLEPANISFPFRKVFQRSKNVQVRMADVERVIPDENTIVTSEGNLTYDYLVLATGCKTNFFGNSELEKHALSMKSTQEAINIRNEILLNFEKFISASSEEKREILNVVIVGGGPTGVELAGAFAEMKKNILPKDYPGIDFSKMSVILVEGSEHTLNSMSEKAKIASEKYLKELGVEIKLKTIVSGYDGGTLTLKSGEQIKTSNVIWAAGVMGNIIEGLDKKSIIKNRYVVDRYNKIVMSDNIYALGDVAYMETPKYPHAHPQLANVAINQAKNLGNNFLRLQKQAPLKEYEYKDLGSMATVGKHRAVVDLPKLSFHGYIAWFTWMFLHLMLILSTRNKLIIFINWAWHYFTKDTSLRLIFKKNS